MLLPAVSLNVPEVITLGYMLQAAAGESAVGLFIGFSVSLIFVGVQIAGMQVGQQMGTGIANVFNPMVQAQISLVSQFYFLFALLIYLGIGGHHMLFRALVTSFKTLPSGWPILSDASLSMVINLFGRLFMVAFAVSAPVVMVLFMTTVVLGFIARTVPQMNVLIIGFPVRVGVALVAMILSLPTVGAFLARTFMGMLHGIDFFVGGF